MTTPSLSAEDQPDQEMSATAPEDDNPLEHIGELVPEEELEFDEDVELLIAGPVFEDDIQ